MPASSLQRNTDGTDMPPFSCRSGLSVPLCISGPSGPEVQPFQLSIKKKLDAAQGSAVHVVAINKRTVKQVGVWGRSARNTVGMLHDIRAKSGSYGCQLAGPG